MSTIRRRFTLGLTLLAAPLALAACGGGGGDGAGNAGNVAVVAYSTPQELYEQDIEPAFNKTAAGKGVKFSNSFGSSGDQSRAVEAGQPADVVHFALATDMQREVDSGLVAADWDAGPYKGIVQDSVVSLVVRKGNPKHIKGWDDLARDDVEVITPNPFTSGGARWNIMAAYGQAINNGKSPAEALDFVKTVLDHTPVQDASARDALQTFVGGKGDVLISYENEAIAAADAGEDVEYVVPDDTIQIETPLAITKDAADPDAAQAFVDYLYSPEGQQQFADRGFRPVDKAVFKKNADKFPTPKGLFTIDDFGGWDKVAGQFFDTENGSVAKIEGDLGVATQ